METTGLLKTTYPMRMGFCALLLGASCVAPTNDGERTDVPDNALGATALQIDRFADHADSVFELRGIGAGNEELALVRLRVGTIADLQQLLPGKDDFGSEIIITSASTSRRVVSREVTLHRLTVDVDPRTRGFLELPTVSSALERDANIIIQVPPTNSELAFIGTATCPANTVMTSPMADQCCFNNLGATAATFFVRPADVAIISRPWNFAGSGAGCKSGSGTGLCQGSACYFGPMGFARASIVTNPGGQYANIHNALAPGGHSFQCGYNWQSTLPTPTFGDVNGTGAKGQGCPGGEEGAGDWDY